MGINTSKPAKRKAKKVTQDPLVAELLKTVREQQSANAMIIKEVLVMQQEQAKMISGMFDMWKPPQGANQSSGLDQRLIEKEDASSATDWEPLDPGEMMEIVKHIGVGS